MKIQYDIRIRHNGDKIMDIKVKQIFSYLKKIQNFITLEKGESKGNIGCF